MRNSLSIIIVAAVLAAPSCGVLKKPTPEIVYRDSVRVETHLHYVRDTIAFYVPEIIEKNVTRDTASHLENYYAQSDAVIADGFLYHSLETIPHTEYIPVEIPVHDTLIVEHEAQVIKETVEVPAKLSWWQEFRLNAFWWIAVALAAALLYIFRKAILTLATHN